MGREDFTKPLPGDQHRAIGAFQRHFICGPNGGDGGVRQVNSGGTASSTEKVDHIELAPGASGDYVSVGVGSFPQGADAGTLVGYMGVYIEENDRSTDESHRWGFCPSSLSKSNSFVGFDLKTGQVEAVAGADSDSESYPFSGYEAVKHYAVKVNYDDGEASFFQNANAFLDSPDVTLDIGDNFNDFDGMFAGIKSTGNDSAERMRVYYLGYIYVP